MEIICLETNDYLFCMKEAINFYLSRNLSLGPTGPLGMVQKI